ncbi:MAG TPA: DNA recombination protein RmuC [Vicinamibacterales bacterium]
MTGSDLTALVFLLLAAAGGGVIGWTLAWALGRARAAAAVARGDELRARITALEAQEASLRTALADSEKARVAAEARAAEAARQIEEERQILNDARTKLSDAFKALAAEALSGSARDFLQLAEEKFKTLRDEAAGDLESRRQAIQTLVGPLHQALEAYQREAREIENRRQRELGSVGEQLRDIAAAHQALRLETSRLVLALRTPHVRGRWGEVALRRIAELAGMSSFCDFVEQEGVVTEGGRLRPDVIVRMPSNRVVVVDAKVPLVAYLEAVEAADDTARAQALDRHLAQVKQHVQKLAARGYATEIEQTAEFVVLFIPNDSFLAAAAERDAGLVEWALAQRVVLATPATLFALLRAIEYGWRQERVAEHAQKISEVGRELSERMAVLVDHLSKMGGSIGKTVEAYNQAVGSLESRVLPTARKLEQLGAGSRKPIESLEPIEQAVRELIPQQLTLEP